MASSRTVSHQLTHQPGKAGDIAAFADRNDRMYTEGTRNLLPTAAAARASPRSSERR